MAEIINLRMARKAHNRTQAEQQAAENRAKYGQSKADKTKQRADTERQVRALDGARREGDD